MVLCSTFVVAGYRNNANTERNHHFFPEIYNQRTSMLGSVPMLYSNQFSKSATIDTGRSNVPSHASGSLPPSTSSQWIPLSPQQRSLPGSSRVNTPSQLAIG